VLFVVVEGIDGVAALPLDRSHDYDPLSKKKIASQSEREDVFGFRMHHVGFEAGDHGLELDGSLVVSVRESSQAAVKGVQKYWYVKQVNGTEFSSSAFEPCGKDQHPYNMTFAQRKCEKNYCELCGVVDENVDEDDDGAYARMDDIMCVVIDTFLRVESGLPKTLPLCNYILQLWRSQDKSSLPDEVYLCDNCYDCVLMDNHIIDGRSDGAYLLQNLKRKIGAPCALCVARLL